MDSPTQVNHHFKFYQDFAYVAFLEANALQKPTIFKYNLFSLCTMDSMKHGGLSNVTVPLTVTFHIHSEFITHVLSRSHHYVCMLSIY